MYSVDYKYFHPNHMKTGASQTVSKYRLAVINKQVSCLPLPAIVSTLCQTVIQFPVLSPPHEFVALAPPVFRPVSEWVDILSTGKTNKHPATVDCLPG